MPNLTDDDIKAIVLAIKGEEGHGKCKFSECPFNSVDPKDLQESVQFYKNFNAVFGKTGNIIWTTILVAGVGGAFTLLALGVIAKIKQLLL